MAEPGTAGGGCATREVRETPMRIGLVVMFLAVGGATVMVMAAAPPPASTSTGSAQATGTTSVPGVAGVERLDAEYDVYADKDKVGKMTMGITFTHGVAIIKEDFQATVQDREVAFNLEQVFRGGDKPVPSNASVSTRIGRFKAMEGTVSFSEGSGGLTAKVGMTGYTDPKGNPLPKPLTENKDVPVPAGTVLTHISILFYGPRLLEAAGQKENITWTELPLWVEFPNLVNFRGACVLIRSKPDADGSVKFTVKQTYSGGNETLLMAVTYDASGRPVEIQTPRFTMRLTKIDGATRTMTNKPPEKKGPILPPPEPIK
jgi:hypothetical protein